MVDDASGSGSTPEPRRTRRDELEAAYKADLADARQLREAHRKFAPPREDSWTRVVFAAALGVFVLLLIERRILDQRVEDCFTVGHPHNLGCAERILDSFWSWELPSSTREQLRAAVQVEHGR